MHCRCVRCQSESENRTRMRVQPTSRALTNWISGATVAEFMYSSFVKSTVTSAPFILSRTSFRTGRRKMPGAWESLTPVHVTMPRVLPRDAFITKPSCENCHFCSSIGFPRSRHGDDLVLIVQPQVEAPFETDAINPQPAAVVGVREKLFQARQVERLLVRSGIELGHAPFQ